MPACAPFLTKAGPSRGWCKRRWTGASPPCLTRMGPSRRRPRVQSFNRRRTCCSNTRASCSTRLQCRSTHASEHHRKVSLWHVLRGMGGQPKVSAATEVVWARLVEVEAGERGGGRLEAGWRRRATHGQRKRPPSRLHVQIDGKEMFRSTFFTDHRRLPPPPHSAPISSAPRQWWYTRPPGRGWQVCHARSPGLRLRRLTTRLRADWTHIPSEASSQRRATRLGLPSGSRATESASVRPSRYAQPCMYGANASPAAASAAALGS